MRPTIRKFDRYLMPKIQSWPKSLGGLMLAATTIGHPIVIVAIVLVIYGYSLASDNLAVTILTSGVLAVIAFNQLLKITFRRKRPVSNYAKQMLVKTHSFPSSHASSAAAGLGLVAYLICQFTSYDLKGLIVIGLIGCIGLIGLSRVYLGAHFPSDVIAGWFVGGVGLWIFIELLALSQ